MKQTFNISVRRSKNFQSVEISRGFEGELSPEEFEIEREVLIDEVHDQVNKELEKLGKPNVDLEVK